jgi:DNA-binding CsgD family transcriptional regulator
MGAGMGPKARSTHPHDADRALDHYVVEVDGVEYAVIAMAAPQLALPEGLTDAETSVLMLVLAGLSNEQIASARGRSLRTVANQVASILEKTRTASRGELIARCRGAPPSQEV